MSAETIVNRLDHCRASGDGEWRARCPSHDDRSPSLSTKDVGDGRTLIHCHAGCGALDVLTAIGLDWGDLYPPTERDYQVEQKQHNKTVDELVVDIAMADMREGKELSVEDMDRASEALKRLDSGEPSPKPNINHVERGAKVFAKRESQRIKEFMGAFA